MAGRTVPTQLLHTLLAGGLCLGLAACDKKTEKAPDDGKSVAEGHKARTEVGKQIETGQKRVDEAEAKLKTREDAILNAGQEDNAQKRGM